MRFTYLFVMLIIFVMMQISLRAIGINFPLLPLLIFYAAYTYGPWFGFGLVLPAAFLLDFNGGWEHPWSVFGFIAVASFAIFWLQRIESDSLLLLAIPGFILPIIGDFPQNLLAGGFSVSNILNSGADALANGVLGAILFPFWIIILDFFGKRLGLHTYGEAKERIKKENL